MYLPSLAWRSVAPHLPTADSGYSEVVRTYSGLETSTADRTYQQVVQGLGASR